ncbi:MAG: hypothetical protein ACRCYO_09330 [Bacteroidia bacterium]
MKGETLVSLSALNAANRRAQEAQTHCDILQAEVNHLKEKLVEAAKLELVSGEVVYRLVDCSKNQPLKNDHYYTNYGILLFRSEMKLWYAPGASSPLMRQPNVWLEPITLRAAQSEEKAAQDQLYKIMVDDPKTSIGYFVLLMGKECVAANVEAVDFSLEADINGKRYEIKTNTTVRPLLNSEQNPERSDATEDASSTTSDQKEEAPQPKDLFQWVLANKQKVKDFIKADYIACSIQGRYGNWMSMSQFLESFTHFLDNTAVKELKPVAPPIDKEQLRSEFFREHTDTFKSPMSLPESFLNSSLPKVCTSPHDLFEWMYEKMQGVKTKS